MYLPAVKIFAGVQKIVQAAQDFYQTKDLQYEVLTTDYSFGEKHKRGEVKQSYHLIFSNLIYKNWQEVRDVVHAMADKYPAAFTHVDLKIYTFDRLMRSLGQSKLVYNKRCAQQEYENLTVEAENRMCQGEWIIQHHSFKPNRQPIKDVKFASKYARALVINKQLKARGEEEKTIAQLVGKKRKLEEEREEVTAFVEITDRTSIVDSMPDYDVLKNFYKKDGCHNGAVKINKICMSLGDGEATNSLIKKNKEKIKQKKLEAAEKKKKINWGESSDPDSYVSHQFAVSMLDRMAKDVGVEDVRDHTQMFAPEMEYEKDLPLLPAKSDDEVLKNVPAIPMVTTDSAGLCQELTKKLKVTCSDHSQIKGKTGVCVTGQMGAGKTTGLAEFMIKRMVRSPCDMMYVAPRILLAQQFVSKLVEVSKQHAKRLQALQINLRGSFCDDFMRQLKRENDWLNKTKIKLVLNDVREVTLEEKQKPEKYYIDVLVVNSLPTHNTETHRSSPRFLVLDELAVLNSSFCLDEKKEESGTVKPQKWMIANLCRVMKDVEGVIFVDAGLSERQMDLCERLMGLSEFTKSFEGQLDLQVLLNKKFTKTTINLADAKIQVKDRLRKKRGYLAIVDNHTEFIKKVFFDRKPIFVCNDTKYPPIFKKINFIDDLDRWVYLIANAATNGKKCGYSF